MALKGTCSTTLSYTSMIGDSVAVYMSATIPEEGEPNRSTNVADKELYNKNKEECRVDMREFDRIVEMAEDKMSEKAAGA